MDSDSFDKNLAATNASINGAGGGRGHKESFYRRVSFHHFHVVSD
jgi:hypothetical protein